MRPDAAKLTVHFSAVDSTPAMAGARVALKADSIRRTLMAMGIPRDSLLTGSRWYWWYGRFEVIPHQQCVPVSDPRVGCRNVFDTTYRAREAIEVRVRDLRMIGAIVDTALRYRITDISPISFSATEVSEIQDELLQEATTRARRQAELIARASGSRLGRIVLLSTEPDYYGRYGGLTEVVVTASAPSTPGTEISAPSISVAATVYGRWRLEKP